ncbi:MAG: NAD-glutamate dehydrogenase [Alphaproteobacteria bacterium]
MATRSNTRKKNLVSKAAQLARKRLGGDAGAACADFVRTYYANVPPADIAEMDAETLFTAAESYLRFAQKRLPGEPLIRVFNPCQKDHGWDGSHTVIEIATEDMPFLVDSVTAELNYQGLTVHLVIHPIFQVTRTAAGKMKSCAARSEDGARAESFMHFEVNELIDARTLANLTGRLEQVLQDVSASVQDWQSMRGEVTGILEDLDAQSTKIAKAEVEETRAFIEWMLDDHFTFLGYREYDHVGSGAKQKLKAQGSGLGLLRDANREIFENWADDAPLPDEVRSFIRQPHLVMVTKANQRATVHRRVHMDVVGVKKFDAAGKVTGERMIVGLFTSTAYSVSPTRIPLLRRKVATTMDAAGFPRSSHDSKALAHILETYPRDELLQIDETLLLEHALGILHLQERQRTALFVREDPFQRYITGLVFVPRDRYDTVLRENLAAILEETFDGSCVAFFPDFGTDSVLARILFVIKTGDRIPAYRAEDIEVALREATRSWEDRLRDALIGARGEEVGLVMYQRYGHAFTAAYRDRYGPDAAVTDIASIDAARISENLQLNLYRPDGDEMQTVRLKLYHAKHALPLSDVIPMLENMGLKVIGEEPFAVEYQYGDGTGAVWVHDFQMESRAGAEIDLTAVRDSFHEGFARVFDQTVADDGFNNLILGAGLEWREILVLRSYCKFLLQSRIAYSQSYMEETLANNPKLARIIVELFVARFDPAQAGTPASERRVKKLRRDLATGLDAVSNLDEDRIIRRFANAVDVTLRTNFFTTDDDGEFKSYASFKIDSANVDDLPEPRPKKEIFVYSLRMEGCHLRGGDVARGGIRWSDRREDFRTEILGLQKAQMVKNSVIVPVGAKGGFVCKNLPAPTGDPQADRQATQEEVIACYSTLIWGLLDVTDNLVGGKIVPPATVVRYDEDDPYLVVAADKGTATFSDIANGISQDCGFWLGDAFASGGSVGYDHKKMGITAKGAWESVKRHFREIGHDTQSADFTAVGVGDMSGDVFGNGMLLSEHINLVAAFNHMHIFIDPNPDPAKSFAERKRLFELPRSSWTDYEKKLISKGGGIFERSAKSIKLTAEIKKLLGVTRDQMTPNELIRTILVAEIDLLWFGGIGTYIKATSESQADADDRSNDAVRVDAKTLRCKVIGEGANLGVTQLGRIEYARAGGRINTDFIDNSAGVDCSDHEVNIKIALDDVVSGGDMSLKQRNTLLEQMTDEVSDLVLNDNYLQTQAISQAERRAPELLESQWRVMRSLERRGLLDRPIENLPDDERMADLQSDGLGLTRPEYAVLFSHAKIALYGDLLPTDVPDDAYLVKDLARYFPRPLRKRFEAQVSRHRLRREIVATYVTNSLINRVGAAFVHDLTERSGASVDDVARAYIIARDVFDLRPLWRDIEALDLAVTAETQNEMAHELEELVERLTIWFLANARRPLDIADTIERYAPGIRELAKKLPDIVATEDRQGIDRTTARLSGEGVPKALAQQIASLDVLSAGGDVVRIARDSGVPVLDTGRIYFGLGARLGIDWVRHASKEITPESEWEKIAIDSIVGDSYRHQSALTNHVLDVAGGGKLGPKVAAGVIETWIGSRNGAVERTCHLLDDLRANESIDLAMLSVANGQLRNLLAG